MSTHWQREAAYFQMRKRDQGQHPYLEVAKWRRRFYAALALALFEALVLIAFHR